MIRAERLGIDAKNRLFWRKGNFRRCANGAAPGGFALHAAGLYKRFSEGGLDVTVLQGVDLGQQYLTFDHARDELAQALFIQARRRA